MCVCVRVCVCACVYLQVLQFIGSIWCIDTQHVSNGLSGVQPNLSVPVSEDGTSGKGEGHFCESYWGIPLQLVHLLQVLTAGLPGVESRGLEEDGEVDRRQVRSRCPSPHQLRTYVCSMMLLQPDLHINHVR